MDTVAYRACHLCEASCGLAFTVSENRITSVRPDREDVFSRGHICPKGVALQDIQTDPDRLTRPLRRTGDSWSEIGWTEATEEIAGRLAQIVERDGGDAVAIYAGNPSAHQIDFVTHGPALARLLGTRNRYSANSVDANPHLLVSLLMFGHQLLIPVPDLDRSGMLLILGANPVVSNGSLMGAPGFKGRMADLRARGGRLVVVDPRRTETAQIADAHLFISPGSDAAFLAALLRILKEEGLVQPGALAPRLAGWDEVWAALDRLPAAQLLQACGVAEPDVRALARDLARRSGVVYARMGLSIQPFATLALWLLNLVNIAIGALDREGGAMFPQPAFDVGGAGGRPATFASFHSRVSGYAECLGELPVAALAEEILTSGPGQVRALVTFAGNPVLSTPNGRLLDRALEDLELMVSFDVYRNETTRHAHYILPSPLPLSVPNFDLSINLAVRNIARVQAALLEPGDWEQPDWVTLNALCSGLAQRLGRPFQPIPDPMTLVDKRFRASGWDLTLDEVRQHPHGLDLGPLRPCLGDRIRTADGLVQCAPPILIGDLQRLAATIAAPPVAGLRLISRREVRSNNSWMHNFERLAGGKDRCVLFVNPADLETRDLADGQFARLTGEAGAATVEVRATEDMMPGVVCMPHGWGHDRDGMKLSVATRAPGVSVNDILDHRRIDPVSGNSAANGSLVELNAL